jgi:hypothetical protein
MFSVRFLFDFHVSWRIRAHQDTRHCTEVVLSKAVSTVDSSTTPSWGFAKGSNVTGPDKPCWTSHDLPQHSRPPLSLMAGEGFSQLDFFCVLPCKLIDGDPSLPRFTDDLRLQATQPWERIDARAENGDPVLCSSPVSTDWMSYEKRVCID